MYFRIFVNKSGGVIIENVMRNKQYTNSLKVKRKIGKIYEFKPEQYTDT